jgi:hypothetical protein
MYTFRFVYAPSQCETEGGGVRKFGHSLPSSGEIEMRGAVLHVALQIFMSCTWTILPIPNIQTALAKVTSLSSFPDTENLIRAHMIH